MIAFAGGEFKLDIAHKGLTQRARNLIADPAWRPDPPPEGMAHLWRWFREIHAGRRVSEGAPLPLAHVDIDAWARLTGRSIAHSEIAIMYRLDHCWFETIRDAKSEPDAIQHDDPSAMISTLRSMARDDAKGGLGSRPKRTK